MPWKNKGALSSTPTFADKNDVVSLRLAADRPFSVFVFIGSLCTIEIQFAVSNIGRSYAWDSSFTQTWVGVEVIDDGSTRIL